MENKKIYYFTFGVGQKHGGMCQPIRANNMTEAREKIFEMYGNQWSMPYTAKEWEKNPYKEFELELIEVQGGCTCGHEIIVPLEAVMDYEIPVDWSKVPIDTKVLVRNNKDEEWEKRYFAKYKDGMFYCWYDGKTSFTSDATIKKIGWNFAKLYKEE